MATKLYYHHLNLNDVFKVLKANPEGFSDSEAKARLAEHGPNTIENTHKRAKIWKFLDQFRDLMVEVLLVAAVVSFVGSVINHESFVDSIAIIAIVILNAILGYAQEERADASMDALTKMQVSVVKAHRNGEVVEIPSGELVPGDIISLEAGDSVPADARLIWETSLQVDESTLTGESLPVGKSLNALKTDTPLSERKNMIYSGTNIVNGRCRAVVCTTGMGTQIGLIANSLQTVKKEITPLQQKINDIGKILSVIIFLIIVVVMVVGLLRGQAPMDAVMLAVSLAVAAIPEGLSAVITIIMSIGVRDMARRHAIVKVLSSVETLGSTEVICSDKTGTITENRMRIRELYYNGELTAVEKIESSNALFMAMALANDAEKNHQKYLGDPTEVALYECLEDYFNIDELRDQNPRIGELPFDSERKMMTTVNKMQKTGELVVWTKGSFDSVIAKCNKILKAEGVVDITEEERERLQQVEAEESGKTYRVLAFAYKKLEGDLRVDASLEEELVFLGLTAMIDSPRPEVAPAIRACKVAGIRPIMITGDSASTATAVAQEVGILDPECSTITGVELDKMSEHELLNNIEKYSVYARVSPMNKLSIVNAWQKKGKVVAMTGDGVNDAPALKIADIGVGMGITGSDVAKAEADVVLTDDSFATIVVAVEEGRKIFDNIKNVLVYLLSGNIAEVLIVFVGMLIVPSNGGEIFGPLQLLYLNLVTDSIPAIMLAYEKESSDIMTRPVQKKSKSFFTRALCVRIAFAATTKTIATIGVLLLTSSATAAFLTLVLSEMAFSYSCRSQELPIWKIHGLNRNLNISMLVLLTVQALLFLTSIGGVIGLGEISPVGVVASIVATAGVFLVDELSKNLSGRI